MKYFSFIICFFLFTSCAHEITNGKIEPPPSKPIEEKSYKSTIVAQTYGEVRISGKVFRANDDRGTYTGVQTGTLNQNQKIADSRVGTENEKCREAIRSVDLVLKS